MFGVISLIFFVSHGEYQKKFPKSDTYWNEFDRLLRTYVTRVFGKKRLDGMVALFYLRHDSYSSTFRLEKQLDHFTKLLEYHLDAVLWNTHIDFPFSPKAIEDLSLPNPDLKRNLFCTMVVRNEMKAALEWLNDLEIVE